MNNSKIKKLKQQLQVEVDAGFLYTALAARQEDGAIKKIFRNLSAIEESHANRILEELKLNQSDGSMPGPSRRARLMVKLANVFGYDLILNNLSSTEKRIARATVKSKEGQGKTLSGNEANHFRILEAISTSHGQSISGKFISKLEGRHKSVGGNALRAAVLGANDGLVSNMSLVMGVAGAAVENKTILITGIAGLLAGSISMALGEWLSVQSARELSSKQLELEAEELESSPEQERKELSLLYQAKGMDEQSAERLSNKVFENKEVALDTLAKEELGIDKEELGGSAWEAAITSFLLFAMGAILPVIPFFFSDTIYGIYMSLVLSIVGLFLIGSAITFFTGKSILFSGLRQMAFGLAASGITFLIGKLIGVAIAG